MLSRVADCLYWLSRFVERAENIARLVDVNNQLMLDVPLELAARLRKNWLPIVECLGEIEDFRRQSQGKSFDVVANYLIFNEKNPNSILSCLRSARENARTVREQISTEMWEELNRAYLWIISKASRQTYKRNLHEFAQQVMRISYLFQGITDTTMPHGEGWEFIQLGKYLERADQTSRALDDQFHLLDKSDTLRGRDLLQWASVLNSCSAQQTYQRVYVAQVSPMKIAELLLLNEDFARSVRFCLLHIDRYLHQISGTPPTQYSNLAERLTGRLAAELSFTSIEDLCAPGLHQSMDELQIKLNNVGCAIREVYINPPLLLSPTSRHMMNASQQ